MLSVLERLDDESKLKLGSDLARFFSLLLSQNNTEISTRIFHSISRMGNQNNDLVRLCLSKQNLSLLRGQPTLMTQILYDTIKFYFATAQFESLVPIITELLATKDHSN